MNTSEANLVNPYSASHRGERGQTILLVAVSLVAVLAMAALAIDVITLYTARAEAQRSADAAALAGAKALVDSGFTTDPGNIGLQTIAQAMATEVINSIVQQNVISGAYPGAPTIAYNFGNAGNPQITVTVTRTGLPIFFARIWTPGNLATVSATATAEAFNPSTSQTITGGLVPVAPLCVKPFLIPNNDPNTSNPFVNVASGLPTSPGTVIGEKLILNAGTVSPPKIQYLPVQVTANAGNLCPNSLGPTAFEHSIECCDANPYSCGGTTFNVNIDTVPPATVNLAASSGVQTLTRYPGNDRIDQTAFLANSGPQQFKAGISNPVIGGPVGSGSYISTSQSIVNIPIYDPGTATATQATVVGFLQVFIDDLDVASGDITVYVLNVAGCSQTLGIPPNTPIKGGGTSPIPIRLIHN